ncbi:MAG: hypothetical protein EXR72_03250 [Myxococcales bacterium]|nr:hypothetical protein [Myxococcales bacterium]
MSKKQTRRSISVRGTTYVRLKSYCEAASLSMSDFVEQRIAKYLEGQPGAVAPARPLLSRAEARPVAAKPAPARVAIARSERTSTPIRSEAPAARVAPVVSRSAVTLKKPAIAALRVSHPAPRPPVAQERAGGGRPAPTPASQIVKKRVSGDDRNDYRAIRF